MIFFSNKWKSCSTADAKDFVGHVSKMADLLQNTEKNVF